MTMMAFQGMLFKTNRSLEVNPNPYNSCNRTVTDRGLSSCKSVYYRFIPVNDQNRY